MKKIGIILALVLATVGCRKESDVILSYGKKDALTFSEASQSFTAQFQALWTGLNCNYGIWDYEMQHGLDWDAVYREYLPLMEELDQRDEEKNPVSDEELEALYTAILSPLHDGHLMVEVKNLASGNYIAIFPAELRNASRPDINEGRPPHKGYYLTPQAGENQALRFHLTNTRPGSFIEGQVQAALQALDAAIKALEAKRADLTDLELYFLVQYRAAYRELAAYKLESMQDLDYFNQVLTTKYQNIGIAFEPFDLSDSASWIDIQFMLFDPGIAYFHCTGFYLGQYLKGKLMASECQKIMTQRVSAVWNEWFSAIQDLHKEGKLKGVVIDLRGNTGGYSSDYAYVLGALLPSGGHNVSSARFKSGVGRLDYSPLTPNHFPTMQAEHAVITEPVVVLANSKTVSMAENTCLGAKAMDNAVVMGGNTWGGLSLLLSDPEYYSFTYASSIGVSGETPFYAYIPISSTISDELGILEGVGVTPDIPIALDANLFEATGRDNQLERALQYIRTGE